MRHVFNVAAGAVGGFVCAATLRLLDGSDRSTVLFNQAFLAAMLAVIIFGLCTCFLRLVIIRSALKKGIRRLPEITDNSQGAVVLDIKGTSLFGLDYLNRVYQEYRKCCTRSGRDCDIYDYINEDLVDSYAHIGVAEIIPDILTSLGILGTFIGLVWGLKNFDPSSYESMALSMSPLISGIKVSFVTSIMGISLSLVFAFWLRSEQGAAYRVLKSFLDGYCSCDGKSETARAMEDISMNQETQIDLARSLPEAVSESVMQSVGPAVSSLENSVDRFIDTVTLNQREIMGAVSANVSKALAVQFGSEMTELRNVMSETAQAQKQHLEYLKSEQSFYEEAVMDSERRTKAHAEENEAMRRDTIRAFRKQQETLDSMTSSIEKLTRILESSCAAQERLCEKMEESTEAVASMRDDVENRMRSFSEELGSAVESSVSSAFSELSGTGLLASEIRKLNAHLEKLEETEPRKRGLSR